MQLKTHLFADTRYRRAAGTHRATRKAEWAQLGHQFISGRCAGKSINKFTAKVRVCLCDVLRRQTLVLPTVSRANGANSAICDDDTARGLVGKSLATYRLSQLWLHSAGRKGERESATLIDQQTGALRKEQSQWKPRKWTEGEHLGDIKSQLPPPSRRQREYTSAHFRG